MPENPADVRDDAVQIVLTRPQTCLLARDIGVVEHDVRPAVRLDRGIPNIGKLIVGIGNRFRMKAFADTFGAATEDADVSGHRLQGGGHAIILFAIGIAPRCPARLQGRRLGTGIHFRQFDDVGSRYAANGFRPFGCLWRVVVLAEDVILEIFLVLGPFGHGPLVHALGEAVDEILIVQIVGEDVPGHACHHCRIGIRLDGYPPGIIGSCRVGVLRIDHDKFAAALFGQTHVVERVAAMERVGRVPAPHDDEFGVRKGVILIAILDGTEGHARGECRALIGRHRP